MSTIGLLKWGSVMVTFPFLSIPEHFQYSDSLHTSCFIPSSISNILFSNSDVFSFIIMILFALCPILAPLWFTCLLFTSSSIPFSFCYSQFSIISHLVSSSSWFFLLPITFHSYLTSVSNIMLHLSIVYLSINIPIRLRVQYSNYYILLTVTLFDSLFVFCLTLCLQTSCL